MTVAADRTIDNLADTGRTTPMSALAPKVLSADEGTVQRVLPGTAIGVPIALDQPISPGTQVIALAFVAATGAPALKQLLLAPVDFTVIEADANGVGTITPVGASQALNTLLVTYSPNQPDGTVGGQSSVSP